VTPVVLRLPDDLVARARALARPGGRRILGITGPPGSGKSTIAAAVVAALGGDAVLVPMDGFHLANVELLRLGRRDRKGAVDTFDGHGYVALLRRLHSPAGEVVYAPEFRREIEEPIAGAIPVDPRTPLVVTEGNYLLVDAEPWHDVAELLDESWYCEPDEQVRLRRLRDRHEAYGKTPDEAHAWTTGSDQRNAEIVTGTRDRADVIVRLA
jgi:pantothenate kinase